MITLHVQPNDENKRLDNFIAKCYPNLLKTLIYKWLRTKKIKVNNKKQEPNYRLQPNDEIVIYLNEDLLNNAKEQIFAKYQPDELFLQSDCKNLQVICEPCKCVFQPKFQFFSYNVHPYLLKVYLKEISILKV